MKIHLIAIGGSAMHNLAIALHHKGYLVTGSDDEIFEPSLTRLNNLGLLPSAMGWFPERITPDMNAVILGMHARADNPELLRAQELGLRIFSYPEYLYEQTKDKQRIVVGGSHGKTSITAMILHVLQAVGMEVDYMVGAQLEGFDCMVRFSSTAKIAVLEGDEYLSSPIDRRPKFHLYYPDIAILSGIAWDHINVFPTFENYVEQFRKFIDLLPATGTLIYCQADDEVRNLAEQHTGTFNKIPYREFPHEVINGITYLLTGHERIPLKIFGDHNLQNLHAAFHACQCVGVEKEQFYDAIQSFGGAARRLELVASNNTTRVYKDFAHSPSKLKATTSALHRQFPEKHLVACMELHTFSSLNADFLSQYAGCMSEADEALVYFNPHTIAHKKLAPVSPEQVAAAFDSPGIRVFTDSVELQHHLLVLNWKNTNLLLMTSGTFDGMDISKLAQQITA